MSFLSSLFGTSNISQPQTPEISEPDIPARTKSIKAKIWNKHDSKTTLESQRMEYETNVRGTKTVESLLTDNPTYLREAYGLDQSDLDYIKTHKDSFRKHYRKAYGGADWSKREICSVIIGICIVAFFAVMCWYFIVNGKGLGEKIGLPFGMMWVSVVLWFMTNWIADEVFMRFNIS
jgi:hypothetical protein